MNRIYEQYIFTDRFREDKKIMTYENLNRQRLLHGRKVPANFICLVNSVVRILHLKLYLAFNKFKNAMQIETLIQLREKERNILKNIILPRDLYNWHGWKIGGSSSQVAQCKE